MRFERLWTFQEYWIARRPGSPNLYRCHYPAGSRQVERRSLGTEDLGQAQRRLVDWVTTYGAITDADPKAVAVAQLLARYYEQHAKPLPSGEVVRLAARQLVEQLGGASVADLTLDRQQRLIAAFQATGKAGSTIKRTMGVLAAALQHAYKRQELSTVPYVLTVPESPPRDRVCSIPELARLWDAAEEEALRWFLVLALGTGARKRAVLELSRFQCDVTRRTINLLPPGQRQDARKRKPIVGMAQVLVPWITAATDGYLVQHEGRPLADIRSQFWRARDRAGLPDVTPHTLRHTVATVLRERNVPEAEAAAFMGHRWSNSTLERYAHVRPDYQHQAAAATSWLISEIGREATRPISNPEASSVTVACQSLSSSGPATREFLGAGDRI